MRRLARLTCSALLSTHPGPGCVRSVDDGPAGTSPLAAAAAVLAVVAGSVWACGLLSSHRSAVTRQDAGRASWLRCPASYAGPAPWVPARPAGVDGRARLTPPRTSTSALVCAYVGSNFAKRQVCWALTGRRRRTAGLAGLAGQLSWQPRLAPNQQIFCAGAGGKVTDYLIGLTYPGGGAMWVTATKDFATAATRLMACSPVSASSAQT